MLRVDNNTDEREDAREPSQDKKDGQYGGLRCRERKRRKRPRNSRQLSQARPLIIIPLLLAISITSVLYGSCHVRKHNSASLALTAPIHRSRPVGPELPLPTGTLTGTPHYYC